MGNSKVIFGNETLIDLTGDTVTPDTLLAGTTAHNRSGNQIVGTATVPEKLDDLTDVNLISPADGDLLQYNGTSQEWENSDEIPNALAAVRDNGAVNILTYPYCDTTKTVRGITYKDNGDGTITANAGTATGNTDFILAYPFSLKAGTYIFSGRPDNSGARLQIVKNDNIYSINVSTGALGTFTLDSDLEGAEVRLRVMNGTTLDSPIVFSPMIYDARFGSDVPFQLHSETNAVLTQKVAWLQKTGCVNRLKNEATSQVKNGVTFTVDDDGITNANGTSTDETQLQIYNQSIEQGVHRIVGCPAGGSASTYSLVVALIKSGQSTRYERDSGNGITLAVPYAGWTLRVWIIIGNGYTANNVVFKPMITDDLSATYDDYQPYSMTNRELTEAVTVEDITSKLNIYTDNFTIYALSAQRCGHIHNINFQLVAVNSGSADVGIDAIAFDDSVMPDSNTTLVQGWHMSSQSKYKGIFNVLRRTGRIAVVPSVAVSVGDYFNCSFMYMKK